MKNIITTLSFLIISLSSAYSASFSVTKTADDLTSGTLRSAIVASNTMGGSNTISITTTGTIFLTSALPVISSLVTIDCTHASGITISGNYLYRIFEVNIPTGTVSFKNLNIVNGLGDGGGGAVYGITSNNGKISFENCTFTGCSAVGSQAYGGAILSTADVDLLNCTITGNSALDGGGAIELLAPEAVLTINHCTIYANSTANVGIAGGIDVYLGTLIITNSIVANNTNGNAGTERDISVDLGNVKTQTSDYNIYGTEPFNGAHDLTNKSVAQVGLSVAGNNGGKVKTMSIGLGSIARNAGTGSVAADARGFARDGIPDIGAYESPTPVATTTAATGVLSTSVLLNGVFDLKGYTFSLAEFEYGYSTGSYTHSATAAIASGTNASFALNSQTPGTIVYYRLVITVDGYKFYGLEESATLSITTGMDAVNSQPQLVYNAATKQLVVNGVFDFMELYDATGKFIKKTSSNSVAFSTSGLVIVRLHNSGKVTTRKIIL